MADEWYCEIAGREIGPLSSEQLRAMAVKGQILPNDCVRQGAQGSWILARQVRGLLPAAADSASAVGEKSEPLSKSPPLQRGGVSRKRESANGGGAKLAAGGESLPVAERLPKATSVSALPREAPPVAPPMAADVFDPVALGIVSDPADVKISVQARTTGVRSRERRRVERQRMIVGVLVAAVVGLAIVGLLLFIGDRPPQSEPGGSATSAKKAQPVKAVASPEALEAREGIESLDSPKPKPHKIGVEKPKMPIVSDSNRARAAATSDSPEAVPPPKPREPKPGTPEGDFGLPMVDQ